MLERKVALGDSLLFNLDAAICELFEANTQVSRGLSQNEVIQKLQPNYRGDISENVKQWFRSRTASGYITNIFNGYKMVKKFHDTVQSMSEMVESAVAWFK
jgi:hypothetical protein